MTLDRFWLLPIAFGHVALFIYIVNVLHGLGQPERVMNRAKLVLLLGFSAASVVLVSEAWRRVFLDWSWPTLLYGGVCILTGVVLFPAATIRLLNRPQPLGVRATQHVTNLADATGAEELIGTGKHAWMLRLPGNESLRLRSVEWDLPIAGLPRALDGLSILHISDLHLAPAFERRFFERVFEAASSHPCDLVLFTGDLVDSDEAIDWIAPLFSRLKGRLGSFAILGNHDLSHHPARLLEQLKQSGFDALEGEWTTVDVNGKRVALGGTSSPWGPALRLDERPEADVSILLSHSPDLFSWAERAGFDLMVAGHNHGGQIRLPAVGPLFMPSRYSRRFDRGVFRRGKLTLHVSQGVAGKHPVRYGCIPEVSRLTLRASAIPKDARPRRALGHVRSDSGEVVR